MSTNYVIPWGESPIAKPRVPKGWICLTQHRWDSEGHAYTPMFVRATTITRVFQKYNSPYEWERNVTRINASLSELGGTEYDVMESAEQVLFLIEQAEANQ